MKPKVSLKIILNQAPDAKIDVKRGLAIFKGDNACFSVPVDCQIQSPALFSIFIADQLRASLETDHLLFVFTSDLHYSVNAYF